MYHIKLSKYCYIDDSIKHGHESQVLNDYFFYIICQKMVNFQYDIYLQKIQLCMDGFALKPHISFCSETDFILALDSYL